MAYVLLVFPILLIVCFLTGPFGVLDETEHYLRAAAISHGQFVPIARVSSTGRHMAGGFVDRQVAAVADEIDYKERYRVGVDKSFKFGFEVLTPAIHRLPRGVFVFSEHDNTALYPPLLYIAPVAGALVGRLIGIPVLAWLYMGRLLNAIVAGGLTYSAIRLAPRKRALFLLSGSLPIVLFEEASVSVGAVLLAALLMFASPLLRLTTRSVESKGEMIVTGIITSMITIGKVAYAPLAILPPCFVLIRDRRFTRQFVTYSTISLLAIVLWALWAVEIHRMVFSMRPDVIVDPQAQLSHLLHNPTFALGVLLHTSHIYLLPVLIETMGHTLGYATIWIKGYLIAILLISILLSGAIEDRPTSQAPDVTYFALSFSVSAICALVVLLLLYLQFNPVGWPIIEGAQGRYFLPLLYLCLALAPTISLPVLTRTAAPQIGFSVYFIGLSGISALTLGIMVLRRYWI